MDGRRVVGAVGRALISAGVLILLFVAYQLWGTGLAEARSQGRLTKQFRQVLAAPPPTRPVPTVPGVPVEPLPPPPPAPVGEAVAIIKIPKIGVEKAIVQGVGLSELKKGPGHYPTTPMPGEPGNAAIAGHRTTYGAPFFNLDELKIGDPILVTTRLGQFRYEVSESKVVSPKETSVLQPADDNRLTLTTCHPRFSAAQRLIVVALLKGEALDPPAPAAAPEAEPEAPAPPVSLEESESAGLSGRNADNGPALLWGLAAGLVWLLTWLAGRAWRKWPAYLLGTPVFLVVLFVFFENFSRLLPSNF
ncbi:MAG TPA: class E sortase [Acidimicrobiales bacterium]|nr:class E sortase [Acidimicrobiales bacterium]